MDEGDYNKEKRRSKGMIEINLDIYQVTTKAEGREAERKLQGDKWGRKV